MADQEESAPLLRKIERHAPMPRADREALRRMLAANVRTIRARADVIEAGERPSEISVVLSGWACRYRAVEGGRRRIVAFYLPGDVCEFNVFLMQALDHPIEAVEPLRVAGISRGMLGEFAKDHPRINQALWWESVVAGAIQREWTVNVGRRSAKQRVGHLLCELYVRLHAVGLARDGRCGLPLTQADIGDACGMTAVHINRTLRKLRAMGLLTLMDGMLDVHDWPGLATVAAFDAGYLHALGDAFATPRQTALPASAAIANLGALIP